MFGARSRGWASANFFRILSLVCVRRVERRERERAKNRNVWTRKPKGVWGRIGLRTTAAAAVAGRMSIHPTPALFSRWGFVTLQRFWARAGEGGRSADGSTKSALYHTIFSYYYQLFYVCVHTTNRGSKSFGRAVTPEGIKVLVVHPTHQKSRSAPSLCFFFFPCY